jgi:hypothetical protein
LALRYAIGQTKLAINPPLLQPNSEIMIIPHPQSPLNLKEDYQNLHRESTKVRLDENQSENRHFLAETHLTYNPYRVIPKINLSRTHPQQKLTRLQIQNHTTAKMFR